MISKQNIQEEISVRFTLSFHAFVSRFRFTLPFHASVSRFRFTLPFHAFVSRFRFTLNTVEPRNSKTAKQRKTPQ